MALLSAMSFSTVQLEQPPRDDGRPSLVAFFLTVDAKF